MKPTKLYSVKLNENHNAQPDKMTEDGYLKNTFQSFVAEYTRGEAIKKARMFGGKIELVREFKCVYLCITERNGEYEYSHKLVRQITPETDISEFGESIAKDMYGSGGEEEDEGQYYFNGGEVMTEVCESKEISYEEYQILSRYL